MDKAEFIVRVLLAHPTPNHPTTPEVEEARKTIKKRYREIRRQMPFTQAEMVSKVEWLKTVL